MKIRIGTRMSKMAMAQAKTVAALLQQHDPTVECEIIGISSHGDRDQKTPLWQLETVGIFSRDLDEKLLAGEIDCAVHSLKDLGTKRPDGLMSAALLKRDNPRDIAIFRSNILDKIRNDKPIIIGSSAPRRAELVPNFLSRALPQLGTKPPVIQMIPLRGNVNTRLKKLHAPEGDTPAMDGIVVALGGLGRLDAAQDAHDELRAAMQGLQIMVMPLTACPGAPGQGTIVVEARADHPAMLQAFALLDDAITREHYARECAVLLNYGGGCHQKFGVVCVEIDSIADPVVIIRGKDKGNQDVSEIRWQRPAPVPVKNIFDGREWAEKIFAHEKLNYELSSAQAAFIAHYRACPYRIDPTTRLWVSGTMSWFKLAQQGLWVEGCADGFGFSFIRDTLAEPFLALPDFSEWAVYTHDSATESWPTDTVIAIYRLVDALQPETIAAAKNADLAWWASASQYYALKNYLPPKIIHTCGPGKTATALQAESLSPLVFPTWQECQNWIAS